MVTVALLLLPRVWRALAKLPRKLIAIYFLIGAIVALHWLAFYAAIKLSNASIAATCIATGPLFLTWIEPLLTSRKFVARDSWIGLLAIPAVALVVGGTPDGMQLGIAVGILSGALVAVFAALNKRFVDRADPFVVTAIEMSAGAVLFAIAGPFIMGDEPMFIVPNNTDLLWLIALSYGCTLLPFVLALIALRKLTAFGTQLATNLEPVYAILLAIPIFGEQRELNWLFYVGVVAIMAIVFAYPFLSRNRDHRDA